MPGGDIDPVYFNSPYYLYPDGPIAVETLRVIGAAMAEAGVVGLGRLTGVRWSKEEGTARRGADRHCYKAAWEGLRLPIAGIPYCSAARPL